MKQNFYPSILVNALIDELEKSIRDNKALDEYPALLMEARLYKQTRDAKIQSRKTTILLDNVSKILNGEKSEKRKKASAIRAATRAARVAARATKSASRAAASAAARAARAAKLITKM